MLFPDEREMAQRPITIESLPLRRSYPLESFHLLQLSDTQQAELNLAFEQLSHGTEAIPTQNAFVHFQTIGGINAYHD